MKKLFLASLILASISIQASTHYVYAKNSKLPLYFAGWVDVQLVGDMGYTGDHATLSCNTKDNAGYLMGNGIYKSIAKIDGLCGPDLVEKLEYAIESHKLIKIQIKKPYKKSAVITKFDTLN